MKKLLFALLFAGACFAQTNTNIQYVTVAPSGACQERANPQLLVPDGTLYTCQSAVWAQVSGAGGTCPASLINVIPKSDGTNCTPSSISDNGTAVSTIEALGVGGAATGTDKGSFWGILGVCKSSADNFSNPASFNKRGKSGDATGAVAIDAELGYWAYSGWDGSTYGRGAAILGTSSEAYTAMAHGARLKFFTTPIGSTTNTLQAMILDTGVLTLGTSDPGDTGIARNAAGVLEINSGTAGTYRDAKYRASNSTGYAFSGLPAAAAGNAYYCSDCTVTSSIDNTAMGGGSGCYINDIGSVHKCAGF